MKLADICKKIKLIMQKLDLKKVGVSSFVLLMLISGCAPIYTPNIIHTPLFSEKNDADIQLGSGTCGYDAQIAYAPLNHLGLMINSSFRNKNVSDTNFYNKHSFVEGGLGYFGKFNVKGRYECYAGYGTGTSENYDATFYGLVTGSYNRYFFQPSVGIKTDVFEGAFSVRLVYLDMYKISKNVGYTRNQLSAGYYEPVFTARVGYKFVKFFMQAGLSIPMQDQLKYTDSPFVFNVGFNLNFSESYFKKKNDAPQY